MRITDTIKLQGIWWRPNKTPKEVIKGTLEIAEPGNIRLELLGETELLPWSLATCIWGTTQNGKPITLFNCVYSGGKSSSPGLSLATIIANVALFGVHASDLSSKAFTEISFSADGLEDWLEISGARVTHNWKRRQHTIRYTLPKPQSYRINRTLKLDIEFSASLPLAGNVRETKIVQSAKIRLRVVQLLSLDEVFSLLHRMNTFLCLAYDQPTALRAVSLRPSKLKGSNWTAPFRLERFHRE